VAHTHAVGEHSFDDVVPDAVRRRLWIAVGVCAVVVVAGLVVLWPRGDTEVRDPALLDADPIPAEVTDVEVAPCAYDPLLACTTVSVRLTGGDRAGETVTFEQPVTSTIADGDGVLVIVDRLEDGTELVTFYDFQRGTPMLLLVLVFSVSIVLLARWRGVGALAGLAISIAIILVFGLPALLDGRSPVAVAIVMAASIAFVAIFLAHGPNLATVTALLSTFASLLLTGVLAWVFVGASKFTGLTDESVGFLDALGSPIDARGLLLAGVVIGSLGVLDDVTVTQVSAVWELKRAAPHAATRELYTRAVRIGRDHISSTVNTLFLAYAGAALPLLLLFSAAGQSVSSVATREVVAVEIVRALVGSLGLIAAVPITTALAAYVLGSTAPPAVRPSTDPDDGQVPAAT
jgi:uncharacterized membrane protein